MYFFNIANKLYLGDNGVYLLSSITRYILIDFFKSNPSISPYFIVNLLWYPAYENFFSIIRKIRFKYSAFQPDNLHLHQMIYSYFNKKTSITKYSNTLSGLSINLFNFLIFCLATINYSNTKYQILIIILSLFVYNLAYYFLFKYKKS